MSFPASTTQVSTDNLDSGADNPALARIDLLQSVQLLNEIIAGQDDAGGVLVLDGAGLVPSARFPQTISYSGSGNQYISPANSVVEIQSILRLAPLIKAQVLAISTATVEIGSIAYCSGVTTGTDAIVVWNGSNWRQIALGTVLS
jgi:hypothetical protein